MYILKYSLRRILTMIPLLFLTSIVVFFLAYMMPGGGMGTDADVKVIWTLYKDWIIQFIQGDFGESYRYQMDVSKVIKEKLNNTLILGITSLLITYILSFLLGKFAGRHPYTLGDHFISVFNYTGLSVPVIIVAVYSIYFFSFELNWFPSNGSVDITVAEGTLEYWLDKAHHLILPATVLGIIGTATYAQLLRNDIIENSRKDYVRTAQAKGTSENKIYNVHILRNSLIPVVTYIGFDFVNIINGSLIVETIFTYPGIGQLFLVSIETRDFPVILNLAMIFTTLSLLGNLVADIMYGIVDPRIKIE